MFIRDAAAVTAHEVTPEGFVRVKARIARAGLHGYRAAELGGPPGFGPGDVVQVYRPPEEVFDLASMDSFRARPVTDDHPPEMVDARNWKRYAIGQSGHAVMRDGDHLVADLLISDAAGARRALAGAELSNGYFADFIFEPGTTPEGEPYDAVQRNIRGNHIALVDSGRCGASCRIGDSGSCDCQTVADLRRRLTDAETEHAQAIAVRDGEIAALSARLADAEGLETLVAERQAAIDAARGLFGAGFQPAGHSTADIRRLVVTEALGSEPMRDRGDAYVAAAFDALASLRRAGNPLAAHLARGGEAPGQSREAALAERNRFLTAAWKGEIQGDA